MRVFKIAFNQLKDDFELAIIIMIELVVVIVAFNIFFNTYYKYIHDNYLYKKLGFDRAITIENKEGIDPKEIIKNIPDVSFLGNSYYLKRVILNNEELFMQPVDDEYINYLGISIDISKEYVQGFFPRNMKTHFEVGKTYSIQIQYEEQYINVYMADMLNSSTLPLPPETGRFIRDGTFFLVYIPSGNELDITSYGASLLVDKSIGISDKADQITALPDVETVYLSSEYRASINEIMRKEMGMPFILSVVILVICIASFSGYNLITILRKEKTYGIYYLCGSTWRRCVLIQMIKDAITLAVPILLSFIIMFALDINREGREIATPLGLVIAVAICILIFISTSLFGLMKLKRKSPIDIIRRLM